jgi:formylmethanofuran dehydrogenase subunit E
MNMKNIECSNCGILVPDVPEDAGPEEMLCNNCFEDILKLVEEIELSIKENEHGK